MKIYNPNPQAIEKEKQELEMKLDEEKRREERHEVWKKSRQFDYVMEIINEEIERANSIDNLPNNATPQELGEFAIIAKAIKAHLQKIKNRLN